MSWLSHDFAVDIDQYPVEEDKRTGICSDPNNPDDPEYIDRLRVETVKIVGALPKDHTQE